MTFYAFVVFLSAFLLFQIQPTIASQTSPRTVDTNRFRLWTDDYSNLFQVLR